MLRLLPGVRLDLYICMHSAKEYKAITSFFQLIFVHMQFCNYVDCPYACFVVMLIVHMQVL